MPQDFRYRRLGYVALNVSDVERSGNFYRDFVGLTPAGQALNGEHLFRCSERHHDIVLHQSDAVGLRRVGWEMEICEGRREAFAPICSRWTSSRIRLPPPNARRSGYRDAFRITEPNTGATFEYFHSLRKAASPFVPSVAKIARLGHMVLFAKDHKAAEKFFLEQLNFRASDRIEGAVTFMRCFPNPLHHSFGLGNAGENRLNHVNFMVTDMDDIGRAMWRMKKNAGADRVRPGPASAVGVGVPVLPRPGRPHARIQLRHGGVPGAQSARNRGCCRRV